MDTTVAVEVVADASTADVRARVRRALDWFGEVESRCSRFAPDSELMLLCGRPQEEVRVSSMLFHVLEIAVRIAQASSGAFDPTVGERLRSEGFDRNHRTGVAVAAVPGANGGTFRDITLNAERSTVTLRRPLSLDLGGVAKGFAVDLAGQELAPLRDFAVNAGGDVFVSGLNADQRRWRVGIRDPHKPGALVSIVKVTDVAVCTSGDYERKSTVSTGHHVVDPSTGRSTQGVASATVIAPKAALADAMATAAFVLGPKKGLRFLERHSTHGVMIMADGERAATDGFREAHE
ncbi:MAG: FAD:protein FMN transferase [Anaerolineaceae bacterium]